MPLGAVGAGAGGGAGAGAEGGGRGGGSGGRFVMAILIDICEIY